ncbi:MAG: aminotransferase class I/II-fold pyridoxal phosphate-dependent enzyme [Hyphomicrobiales bacterium]|nr:MAG: aminotransferase class I/II-fold pyridoxal phosphate-dependent enzyme [Hyphomicrobiales bacterium]
MSRFASGLEALATGAMISPFVRARRLLDGTVPGNARPIELTIGDPREAPPEFVPEKLAEAAASNASYPKIRGSDELKASIARWIERRFAPEGGVDAAIEILPCNGSREGLFYAALPAVGRKRVNGRPVMLIVNPFYQTYLGAALATQCEPVMLNATAATGHLPDLDALAREPDLLARTVGLYVCSPANPQGTVASPAYIEKALELARAYDFILFFDECYSEIYTREAPVGALQVAARTRDRYRNLVVFNSLSKRSNLPGLRSGFLAGDGVFLETLAEIRNMVAPQMPGPVQHASAAVWDDDAHTVRIRKAYQAKFDICDRVLGSRFGYARPAGGFFLWLDVSHLGGAEEATLTLWKRSGVRVIPGAYLAEEDRAGVNPGSNYVRVALVQDPATIQEALERLVQFAA